MAKRMTVGVLAALLLTLALVGVAGAERRPVWPTETTAMSVEF